MKQTVGIMFGVVLLASGVLFFTQNQPAVTNVTEATPLAIATSFYPLEFALKEIVGDLGTVANIGAGRDPHDFQPSTQDMVTLKQADVVVLQGADFEPWGDDVQTSLAADGVPVIIATAEIDLHEGGHDHDEAMHTESNHHDEQDDSVEHTHEEAEHHEHADDHTETAHTGHTGESEPGHNEEHDHEHGAYDPHTWLDPLLFSDTVDVLAKEIAIIDPDNATTYANNARELQAKLADLHTRYQDRLTNCAFDEVITSHDAFGYLGDRYGFTIHTIAGLSTQDTPSAVTLAELRAEAAERIDAILLEENSITAYGETLARETGLKTLSVNPVAYLIPDDTDYISLMEANLDTFAIALACDE